MKTINEYKSPDGKTCLTWGDLYAIFDDLPVSYVRLLLVYIMDGEFINARMLAGKIAEKEVRDFKPGTPSGMWGE